MNFNLQATVTITATRWKERKSKGLFRI